MFRKVTKNKNKKRFLKKNLDEDKEDSDEKSISSKSSKEDEPNIRFKKRTKTTTTTTTTVDKPKPNLLNEYKSTSTSKHLTEKELVTKTVEFHPEQLCKPTNTDQHINTKASGPMRAPTFIRSTTRFDYQPDICKDYKQTGFCGFGDTCIYLHDRGDTLSGWQLERQWEEKKKKEQSKTEKDVEKFMNTMMNQIDGTTEENEQEVSNVKLEDDGIPFACHLCRSSFNSPIITICSHYFCEACIMTHYKTDKHCPICSVDINGIFNHPQKLYSKKKKLVGKDGSWVEYYNLFNK